MVASIEEDIQNKILSKCYDGDLEAVKSYYNQYPDLFTEQMSEYACRSGNLELVKWLTDGLGLEYLFAIDEAALFGHLETVKWLHENRPSYGTEEAIDSAANEDHENETHVIEWLLENRNDGFTEEALFAAARNDNLDLLKLLFEKNPSVLTGDVAYEILKITDESGNLEIIKWLQENEK